MDRQSARQRLIGEIRRKLDSYPNGRERYRLGEPYRYSKSGGHLVRIYNPQMEDAIGTATFTVRKGGQLLHIPSDRELSKAIMDKLQILEGVK